MAITGALVLALLCVAMLIFYVNHVASRINFDTVIDLVYQDLQLQLDLITGSQFQKRLDEMYWDHGLTVSHGGSGYLQQLDDEKLANWAAKHVVALRLNARVGDFIFPGAPLARVRPCIADAAVMLRESMVLGSCPTPSGNLEYAVEQLVDIAVRALSSGINDPRTANRILDRLGATLCIIANKPLPAGAIERNGRVVYQRNRTTYGGLTDAMFHAIRQSAKGSPSVLIHMVDILTKVAHCESSPERRATIRRHGNLISADGDRDIANPSDMRALQQRMAALGAATSNCP